MNWATYSLLASSDDLPLTFSHAFLKSHITLISTLQLDRLWARLVCCSPLRLADKVHHSRLGRGVVSSVGLLEQRVKLNTSTQSQSSALF